MKKKFLIYTSGVWSPNVGGVIILHKLCHDLNTIGEEAYITDMYSHPSLTSSFYEPLRPYTPIVQHQDIKYKLDDDTIVIYPAGVHGNPLNAKHIVRWIMHPNRLKELNKYSPLGMVFKYHNLPDLDVDIPILTTLFFDFLTFTNHNLKREGDCFMVRKGVVKTQVHPTDALDVHPHCKDWTSLAYIFNRKKHFYCYDTGSGTVLLAALCGCIPIIIDQNDNFTPVTWKDKTIANKYGVAYGINDIDHAINTIKLVPAHLKKCNKIFLESIKQFAKICHTKFVN